MNFANTETTREVVNSLGESYELININELCYNGEKITKRDKMFKSFKNIVEYAINTGNTGEKDAINTGTGEKDDKKSHRLLNQISEEENTVNE